MKMDGDIEYMYEVEFTAVESILSLVTLYPAHPYCKSKRLKTLKRGTGRGSSGKKL